MSADRNKHDRPESYPKPTETDEQLKNQPEFIDQEPNTYTKEVSDIPRHEDEDAPNVTRVTEGGTSGGEA